MGPTSEPNREAIKATDAVFQEGSPAVASHGTPPPPPAPPAAKPEDDPGKDVASPLEDYVRELGQEYQKQQDEGRL